MEKTLVSRKEIFGTLLYNLENRKTFCLDKSFNELGYIPIRPSSPLVCILEITSKCNFECIHCSAAGTSFSDMKLKQIKKIIKELNNEKIFEVQISGGEPFLRKDIFKLLDLLKKENFSVTIYSNGSKLNKTHIRRLKKYPFEIMIGLDGKEKIHNFIRNRNCFKDTIKAIELLKKERIQFGIITSLTKLLVNSFEEFIKYLISLKVKKLILNDLMPSGRGKEIFEGMRLNKLDYKRVNKIIKKYEKKIKIRSEIPSNFDFKEEKTGCGAGHTLACIRSNGMVTPCSFLPSLSPKHSVEKKSFKEIWNSNEMKNFIKTNEPYYCKKCPEISHCHGGCKAISLYETGKYNSKDSRCPK